MNIEPAIEIKDISISLAAGLTRRQCEALGWTAHGLSHKEVSREMNISARTVKAHIEDCKYKLGAISLHHLIGLAWSKGVVKNAYNAMMLLVICGMAMPIPERGDATSLRMHRVTKGREIVSSFRMS